MVEGCGIVLVLKETKWEINYYKFFIMDEFLAWENIKFQASSYIFDSWKLNSFSKSQTNQIAMSDFVKQSEWPSLVLAAWHPFDLLQATYTLWKASLPLLLIAGFAGSSRGELRLNLN